MPALRLLVGLGNPGDRYARTRHNAGFRFVDRVADRAGACLRAAARFRGDACEVEIAGHRLRLLKPLTFMNRSGESVAALAQFYRIAPAEILVAHDEIDLPPGVVRLKVGGGDGGHKGLRDVIPRLGDRGFARLRIGVGHPGRASEVVDYVLRRAPAGEHERIGEALERVMERLDEIVAGEFQQAMNTLHRDPADAGTTADPG